MASSFCPTAWPGIGIERVSPLVMTEGNISYNLLAAVSDLRLLGF